MQTLVVVALQVGAAAALAPLTPAARAHAVPMRTRTPALQSVATAPILTGDDDSASGSAAVPAVGLDAWANTLDYKQFRKEVHGLGTRLANEQNEEDVEHLKKMISWSNGFGLMGLATMWMSSPLGRLMAVVGLSTWTCTRWTMIGHHICHGGYNRQDDPKMGGTGRFTSTGFALGSVWRRARDWFDWMLPEAWNVEHNNLHHFRTGEDGDPDLVERNVEMLREAPIPRILK